ncbi:polyamine aminopropyltransferase [Kangiella koreensis]|uniref:Polyamine aminopropyltransferase n=1 Tax=Kangiella koreensis (strain DSM 16069 / JCM 12317 / KCTC 12182 / SW-125) TaxID=523791 RepID=C7RBA6_KANKD|nr:polyamine aminopropyltransferase [Kangiella koreensis]ACV26548.1 spermidine synthase [Kangiella koreensis DSM 16069]
MAKRFIETLYSTYGQSFIVDEVLFESKTEHQHLIIFKNEQFGHVMALDGVIQTTEKDEFIYHEMLTHVPLFAHGNAKRVLIIGGGDGGILREVLRHPEVEQVTMVEIDAAVVDMCKQYFPKHSDGAFDDPRVNLVIADGVDFIVHNANAENGDRFDVIISDSTDPEGPAEVLFTSRFYQGCKNSLNEGGILATQNGVSFMQIDEVKTTYNRFKGIFDDRWFYVTAVPTYIGGNMTLSWGSDDATLRQHSVETIRERFSKANFSTRYYNPELHVASFALPQYVIEALK